MLFRSSIYDLAAATRVHRHPSSCGRPHLLCFLPNGRLVEAVGDSMCVYVEPAVDGGQVGFYPDPVTGRPHSLFASPDGARLLAVTELVLHCWTLDGHVPRGAWAVEVGTPFATFAAALSPDGERIVVCQSALGLKQYSARTGEEEARRDDMTNFGTRLAWSPDGARLAGILKRSLWIARPDGSRFYVTTGSRHHFAGLAWHPSGRWLLTGRGDGSVCLHDPATLGVEQAYTWPVGKVRTLAVSRDGMLAAVGGDKGQVVVWDMDG